MKIYNYSRIECNRAIWRSVASSLAVGGRFRDAQLFDRKQLVTVIHKEESIDVRQDQNSGEYSCGRIDIYPCVLCTPGFLFWTYLHELLHHWIDDKHGSVYFESWVENVCDNFASAMFTAHGGRVGGVDQCGTYSLGHARPEAIERIVAEVSNVATDNFQALAQVEAWAC